MAASVDPAGTPREALGRRLEAARRRRGWSFRELQERTGLPRSTLHYLFRDRKRAPDYYVLTALVVALGEEWDLGWEQLWRSAVDAERVEPSGRGRATGPPHWVGPVAVPEPGEPGATRAPVPRQLPPGPGALTARADAQDQLDALLAAGGPATAAVVGPGGIGKTALALHWAHTRLDAFSAGQLYADLRGFGPGRPPPAAETVLHGFLLALGVPAADVPAGVEVRAALYRSLVAGRRLLVVLDNAASSDQVLPMLPGSPTCRAVVTSRADLTTLAVRGALRLTLGTLPDSAAHDLLALRVGTGRLAAEPAATEQLVRHCGGLPLALSVLATRIAARPGFPLAAVAAELADATTRLDALDTGEIDTSLRAVFSWSYGTLDPTAARLFRLLGTVGIPDVATPAAAALAGLDPGTAGTALRRLAGLHLLTEHRPGRYRIHDLVRLFAAERAAADEPDGAVAAANTRLLVWYLHAADAVDRLLVPHRWHVLDHGTDQPTPDRPSGVPGFDTAEQALAWCEAEHVNAVAAMRSASTDAARQAAWRLPQALFGFYQLRLRWPEWLEALELALPGVRRLGDRSGESWTLNALGIAYTMVDRPADGKVQLRRALSLRRELGDLAGEGQTLNNLGELHRRAGRHGLALRCHERDAEICRQLGDPYAEAIALNNLGNAQDALGRPEQSLATQQRALRLILELGDRPFEAEIRHSLGRLHRAAGRTRVAEEEYRRSAEVAIAEGDLVRRAAGLVGLTEVTGAAADASAARAAVAELTGPDAAALADRLAAAWPIGRVSHS